VSEYSLSSLRRTSKKRAPVAPEAPPPRTFCVTFEKTDKLGGDIFTAQTLLWGKIFAPGTASVGYARNLLQ